MCISIKTSELYIMNQYEAKQFYHKIKQETSGTNVVQNKETVMKTEIRH